MYLGIEIGGTKLQLGVGDGRGGELLAVVRREVDRQRGASGILEEIGRWAPALLNEHRVTQIGIGFGGPVNSASGRTTKSHQVEGWENYPLADWCQQRLGKAAVLGNDCDVAALAEARYGAGRGAESVFYVTVGTGIGGGLVLGGKLHGSGRPAAAEIGHLRPGLDADMAEMTVESIASGPAIALAGWAAMEGGKGPNHLTARAVAEAAAAGDVIALAVLRRAWEALGWAIAQTITLLAPEIVVVGGGVSLMGEELFFQPLRDEVERFVFPPLKNSYKIVPAGLGELAVVHGAIALAASEGPEPATVK